MEKYFGRDVLYKNIEYRTDVCKRVLDIVSEWELGVELSKKKSHSIKIELGRGVLDIGLGGIHYNTKNPFVFLGNDKNYILDGDINSHYPTMIINNKLCPEGLEDKYSSALEKVMLLRKEAKT